VLPTVPDSRFDIHFELTYCYYTNFAYSSGLPPAVFTAGEYVQLNLIRKQPDGRKQPVRLVINQEEYFKPTTCWVGVIRR